MHPATSPAPADRFALIIEGLCHAVARRGGRGGVAEGSSKPQDCWKGHGGGLAGPFLILIWSRLRRSSRRSAWRGNDTHLLKNLKQVKLVPMLDKPIVFKAPDINRTHGDICARSRHTSERPLVTAMCEYMREDLENARPSEVDSSCANRLASELSGFTSGLIEPDALGLYRLIVAEGWRFPDLARVFEQSGMRMIRQRIANILEAGGVSANQSRHVAAEVIALALGDAYQHAVLGIVEERDSEVFAQQIEAAVRYGLNRAA